MADEIAIEEEMLKEVEEDLKIDHLDERVEIEETDQKEAKDLIEAIVLKENLEDEKKDHLKKEESKRKCLSISVK